MKEARQRWRPSKSLYLHYMQSNTISAYSDMHFGIPPNTWAGPACEFIDASNDLIILCRFPSPFTTRWTTFPTVESIGALYEFNPVTHVYQGAPSLPTDLRCPLRNPVTLLEVFPRLRVLYIILKPQNTMEQMVGPPQFAECIQNYYSHYIETELQFPPKTFNARQRIYYELPKAITKTMYRGLDAIFYRIEKVSDEMRMGTGLPLVIRVMTWKNAPGVRGRFDRE